MSAGDETYGDAVVVTVTFKGEGRLEQADRLERAARRLGAAGVFTEQVDVDVSPRLPRP